MHERTVLAGPALRCRALHRASVLANAVRAWLAAREATLRHARALARFQEQQVRTREDRHGRDAESDELLSAGFKGALALCESLTAPFGPC